MRVDPKRRFLPPGDFGNCCPMLLDYALLRADSLCCSLRFFCDCPPAVKRSRAAASQAFKSSRKARRFRLRYETDMANWSFVHAGRSAHERSALVKRTGVFYCSRLPGVPRICSQLQRDFTEGRNRKTLHVFRGLRGIPPISRLKTCLPGEMRRRSSPHGSGIRECRFKFVARIGKRPTIALTVPRIRRMVALRLGVVG
jgi:hypothetical protein